LTTWRGGAAALGMVLLAGCSTSTPVATPVASPGMPDPRARSHFTVVWSDSAGLDLLSPEGTYIRASVESMRLSAGNANRDAAYPGFWATVTGSAQEYVQSFLELGPDDSLYGVSRYEVIDVARERGRFVAGLCIFERQLGIENLDPATGQPDGRFTFSRMGSYYWRLVVETSGDTAPPADQRGRDAFPESRVFGSWRTVQWARPGPGESNPCEGRAMPGVEPGSWPELMPGSRPYLTDTLPVAPNDPGWSNAAA
jgi:hypothetical protein